MAKSTASRQSKKRRQKWFAARQVYLRTGQASQYVELSPLLQVGVALGFAVVALWLIGASYGAVTGYLKSRESVALATGLAAAEEQLSAAEAQAAKLPDLEAELKKMRASAAEARENEKAVAMALSAELDQTRAQLDDARLRLSESKAEEAALTAKLEARSGNGSESKQAAEQASSLYDQLEEAYREIESLRAAREAAEAKLADMATETTARLEQADRNESLIEAATAEIERLQETIVRSDQSREDEQALSEARIADLQTELQERTAVQDDLQAQVEELTLELQRRGEDLARSRDDEIALDAERQASAILADLREADLLATIERQHAELSSVQTDGDGDSKEVEDLRKQLRLAELEIERMVRNGLMLDDSGSSAPDGSTARSSESNNGNAGSQDLSAALATAQADIIKLKADLKAAKERLADRSAENVGTRRSGNATKLEQQLASTRSRVQQLNKALANAKLREVAIDLALINVVPSPSPPAPR